MNSKELQKKFSEYVRHGYTEGFPEVDGNMFPLYHNHLRKKLSNLLSFSFALTQEAMGPDLWERCILAFLKENSASGESILGLSQAFYSHLIQDVPLYLKNLVSFEYLLIELFYLEDIPPPPFQPIGNRLESPVVLNPEHRFLVLDYPVFKYRGSELIQKKGDYYLFLYRHPTLFTVEIIELSAFYFSALSLIANRSISLLAAMEKMDHEGIDIEEIVSFYDLLKERGAILGFQ